MTDSDPANLQSAAIRKLAVQALEDLKAEHIVQLDVRRQASFTDCMIFASGNSTRHVGAIAEAVIEAAGVLVDKLSRARGIVVLGVAGMVIAALAMVTMMTAMTDGGGTVADGSGQSATPTGDGSGQSAPPTGDGGTGTGEPPSPSGDGIPLAVLLAIGIGMVVSEHSLDTPQPAVPVQPQH